MTRGPYKLCLQTSLRCSIISVADLREVRGRQMFGNVVPVGDLKRRHSRDNNALHTEPRAARVYLLASRSPRPGERCRYQANTFRAIQELNTDPRAMPQNLNPFQPPKSDLNQTVGRFDLRNFLLGLLTGGAVASAIHSILELRDNASWNFTPPYFGVLAVGVIIGGVAGWTSPKSKNFTQACIVILIFSALLGMLIPAIQQLQQQEREIF